jgi:hypothetical protein
MDLEFIGVEMYRYCQSHGQEGSERIDKKLYEGVNCGEKANTTSFWG